MKARVLLMLAVITLLFGCNIKFSKDKWAFKDGTEYPYRPVMLRDLTKNYNIRGMKYTDLVKLIGLPESKGTDKRKNEFYYNIKTNYGWDNDIIGGVTLVIVLSKDSVVDDFKIHRYKR
ncbi:MAG: hypothetical protein Q8862_11725 [Bacteroidota bacterium]|nr:hypothetical protein [Bacteroidota bacterium]